MGQFDRYSAVRPQGDAVRQTGVVPLRATISLYARWHGYHDNTRHGVPAKHEVFVPALFFDTDPSSLGVCGVIGRPEGPAFPNPRACTIRPLCTKTTAIPGIAAAARSCSRYVSSRAKSSRPGPGCAAEEGQRGSRQRRRTNATSRRTGMAITLRWRRRWDGLEKRGRHVLCEDRWTRHLGSLFGGSEGVGRCEGAGHMLCIEGAWSACG